jgi:hypothetical protein
MSTRVRGRLPFVVGGVLLAGWLATVSAPPATAQDSDKLLAEVKAAWQKRQDAIRSGKFTWTHHRLYVKGATVGTKGPDKDVVDNGSGSLLLEGNRTRIEIRDLIWKEPECAFVPQHRESTYDGKKYITLDHRPGHNKFPYGLIIDRERNQDFSLIDYWPLAVAVRGLDAKISSSALERLTQARRTVLDGRPVIELSEPRTETRGGAKVWVDPTQDYSVRRREKYLRAGELLSRTDVISEHHASGEWLPKRWTVRLMAPQGKLQRQTDVTMKEVIVNLPTTDADFEIVFPPRAMVDEWEDDEKGNGRLKASFIVRDDGSHRPITPGELKSVLYEDLLRTEPGELTGENIVPWWKSRWWLLTMIGVVLAVVLLGILVVRWRASRRKSQPPPTVGTQ